MFCSGCGKEIPEGSKFCPGCGKATDGIPNVTNAASDPTKILKEGDFRRMEKLFARIDDAKLTLFCDRLEWHGRVNEIIKLDDIVTLSIGRLVGLIDPTLEITDRAGKTRKFFRERKEMLAGANRAASLDVSLAEIESWRTAIDKLRGRL
jgi:hypothetical protein